MARYESEEVRNKAVEMGGERFAAALGIEYKREGARGGKISCPWHAENTPSCSLQIGKRGDLVANCFACGKSGDAIGIVAAHRDIDIASDYERALAVTAEIVGATPGTVRTSRPAPPPTTEWPDEKELLALWNSASMDLEPAEQVLAAWGHVPRNAARILRGKDSQALGLGWWPYSGDFLIAPLFDATGTWRSVQGRNLEKQSEYRVLMPKGKRGSPLFFADAGGAAILQRQAEWKGEPPILWITEGLTDSVSQIAYLRRRERQGAHPRPNLLIGVGRFSTEGFKDIELPKIPGATLMLALDADDAGRGYAEEFERSQAGRWATASIELRFDEQLRRVG